MSSYVCEYDQGRQDFQPYSGHTSSGEMTYNLPNKTSTAAAGKETTSTPHFLAQNQNFASYSESGSSCLPKIEMEQYYSGSHQHYNKHQLSSNCTSNPLGFGTHLEVGYRKKTFNVNEGDTHQQTHGNNIQINQYQMINSQSISNPNSSLPGFGRYNSVDHRKYYTTESTVIPNKFFSSNLPEISIKNESSARSNSSLQIPYNQARAVNSSQVLWDTNSRVKSQFPIVINSYSLVEESSRNIGLLNSAPQSHPIGNSSSSANICNISHQFPSKNVSVTKDNHPSHCSIGTYESSIGVSPNLYSSSVKSTDYRRSSNIYSTYQQNKSLQSNSFAACTSLNTSSSKAIVPEIPYYSTPLITETKLRSMLQCAPTLEEYVPMKPFVSTLQKTQNNLHCYPTLLSGYEHMPPKDRQQNIELPPMYSNRKPTLSSSSEYAADAYKSRTQHSYQHFNNDKPIMVFCDSITMPTANLSCVQQNSKDRHEQLKKFHTGQIPESKIQLPQYPNYCNDPGMNLNEKKQILMTQKESHIIDKDNKCNCNQQACNDCLPRIYYQGNSEPPVSRRFIDINLKKNRKMEGSSFTNSTNNEPRGAPNLIQCKPEIFDRQYAFTTKRAGQLYRYSHPQQLQLDSTSTNAGRGKLVKSENQPSKNSSISLITHDLIKDAHSNFEETNNLKFPYVIESPIKFRTKAELKQMCPPTAPITVPDPIISKDEWSNWSLSFSNEWEKFMENLSVMKNVKRVNRISKLISKPANIDSSFTTNPAEEYLSEEDVPLSVRRQKTNSKSPKRKISEDLLLSGLLSTDLSDTNKQESLIPTPLAKQIKLEINPNDVFPVDQKANDMSDSANLLEIKAKLQQLNSKVLKSESAVSKITSSEYSNISTSSKKATLHHTAELGQLQEICYLLNKPETDISLRDSYGFTALEIACTKGHVDVAKVLLEYGANTNLNSQNHIIRSLKAAVENDHVEVARLLLSYGAEPVSVDDNLILHCKSEYMKDFLNAYINDINGNVTSAWGFLGSVCFMDATTQGFNALDCSGLE